jgi:hypothetical protein
MEEPLQTSNYVSTLRNPSFGGALESESPALNQSIPRESIDVEMVGKTLTSLQIKPSRVTTRH